VPKGTHEWSKFISPQDVKIALRRSGMYVDDVKGLVFHPLTQECSLSDKHTGVNYVLHAIKRTA
jgi:2-polyprenyl-3-methyl-5-hydroxy-6-metoxy-1,4-benzoquinol methylase